MFNWLGKKGGIDIPADVHASEIKMRVEALNDSVERAAKAGIKVKLHEQLWRGSGLPLCSLIAISSITKELL
jgi:hypothetical protein